MIPNSSLNTSNRSLTLQHNHEDASELENDQAFTDNIESGGLVARGEVYGPSKNPGNVRPSTYQVDAPNNIMDFTGYGGARDQLGRSAAKIRVPDNVLVVSAHGSAESTTLGSHDDSITFTPEEMVQAINRRAQKTGLDLNKIDKIMFVSCSAAIMDNGNYLQKIANGLKTNVYGSTEIAWVLPQNGNVFIASRTRNREPNLDDPGKYLLFAPGGNPRNNKLLQLAIAEERYYSGQDIEFNPSPQIRARFGIPENANLGQGLCFNEPLRNCIPE